MKVSINMYNEERPPSSDEIISLESLNVRFTINAVMLKTR